ncbi:RNA polymerase sigma factor [Desulfatibacillum aliphaticivorans]|uniref:RNA polymerase sigma factor n=1 Tax=Desulfatibacillum aliphaticivorans TaxID=218208 RepID=UPI0004126583|nr:RNA polymerase sigma factor [Desulfatibacillum aliphaticivorans]
MEFDSFYKEYRSKVFAYLLRMTGSKDLSMDLVQESFTRCLERYAGTERPGPLVFTIARNLVYDNHRRQARWDDREAPELESNADPETAFLIKEKVERVLKAMQRLPDSEKEALALATSKALTYREIAQVTGVSEANVKVRVHRARKSLRRFLEDMT